MPKKNCSIFKRVNRSIRISADNKQWRRLIDRKGKDLPRLIRMQGRSSTLLFISNVNKYIDSPIINIEEKTVYYKKVTCDICHIGHIKINKSNEKQCNHCGYIYESKDLNTSSYIDEDDITKESINQRNKSWDILKFDWQYSINKEAYIINERYKRIREYEKGNKNYQK